MHAFHPHPIQAVFNFVFAELIWRVLIAHQALAQVEGPVAGRLDGEDGVYAVCANLQRQRAAQGPLSDMTLYVGPSLAGAQAMLRICRAAEAGDEADVMAAVEAIGVEAWVEEEGEWRH